MKEINIIFRADDVLVDKIPYISSKLNMIIVWFSVCTYDADIGQALGYNQCPPAVSHLWINSSIEPERFPCVALI